MIFLTGINYRYLFNSWFISPLIHAAGYGKDPCSVLWGVASTTTIEVNPMLFQQKDIEWNPLATD
tara:strand:+ start:636 stop:830 length:195 start_codon:yes stop_codon:yes gene_type:complete